MVIRLGLYGMFAPDPGKPERKSECLKNRIQHIGSNGVLNAVLEKASPDLVVYSSEVIIYIPP